MDCEVIVVGAGMGGLATAAILAARGLSVCVFERQSYVGGCVANFQHLGYVFEPTAGLYSGWQPKGTYDRLFSELRLRRLEVRPISPAYVVRLPDQTEIAVAEDSEEFSATIRRCFPECAGAAINFYSKLSEISRSPGPSLLKNENQATSHLLTETSTRFRRFIDVQLQTLTQRASDMCPLLTVSRVLTAAQRGLYAIRGGAQALADDLARSIKENAGVIRLNSPVLRLAYSSDGSAIGIDLLSGERVIATRAIVSNLTIWDTYGKLIGPGRTPKTIALQLKNLHAWGAYLLFAAIEEAAASSLPANQVLIVTDLLESLVYVPDEMQLVLSISPEWDRRGPPGKRAVTISTFTHVDEWFSFHQDETAHEEQDQATLERLWSRLHTAMPELGDTIEVIETATPRTVYETTRRRLGMVGSPTSTSAIYHPEMLTTAFPNVFMIGDTVSAGFGLEGVCASAMSLADQIAAV